MPASQIGTLRETPLTIAFPCEIPGGIRPSPRKSECFFFFNRVKPIFNTLMITVVVKMCERLPSILLDLPICLIEHSRETLNVLKFKYFILTYLKRISNKITSGYILIDP